MRGLLLTLEGIEGSGKTTQARKIKALLDAQGVPALLTREPGGSPIAEQIRDLVLVAREEPLAPHTELLLFLAARAQHVRQVIRPALERGDVVVCDRFTDATLAYQGGGRTMPDEFLRALNDWAAGGICPKDLSDDDPWKWVLPGPSAEGPAESPTASKPRERPSSRGSGIDTSKPPAGSRNELWCFGVRIRRRISRIKSRKT